MPPPAEIDLLVAESAIRRLAYTYTRGGDRIDAEVFKSTFWPEGVYDRQQYAEPVSQIGDELINLYMNDHFWPTHHLNGNMLIDLIDEDSANTEIHFLAFHLTQRHLSSDELRAILGATRFASESVQPGQSYEVVVGGRYIDPVERRDGI